MTVESPTYDLVLLLDLSATDEVRAKIVTDTRAAIEAEGTLIGHHPWGQRPLAYPIERHESAEYHLFQLHATNELLDRFDHTLKITDGVLRHRVIKLKPGTPAPPEQRAPEARPAESAPPVAVAEPAPAAEPVAVADETPAAE